MITAVLTAYKPKGDLVARFAPLLDVCGAIVVSDNTPGGCSLNLPEGFTLIQHRRNLGLGPAINIGIETARKLGATTVILFDQDSTPTAELVANMMLCLQEAKSVVGNLCCITPTHVDDGNLAKDLRISSANVDLTRSAVEFDLVTCAPTSGLIFSLDSLPPEDLFTDELFLDLVDFEWCWRLRVKGWHFFRSRQVLMPHRLGEAERRFMGLTFYEPAPYRHYFQVRDTLRLCTRNYVPAYSKFRLLGVLPLKFFAYPFLLDNGFERLKWMMLGVRDAFRGVCGIGAARKRLS